LYLGNKKEENKIKKLIKLFDKKLQEKGKTYAKARNEFGRLDAPKVSIVEKGSFAKKEKEIISTTGQAKPTHISKDTNCYKKFKIIKTTSTNEKE